MFNKSGSFLHRMYTDKGYTSNLFNFEMKTYSKLRHLTYFFIYILVLSLSLPGKSENMFLHLIVSRFTKKKEVKKKTVVDFSRKYLIINVWQKLFSKHLVTTHYKKTNRWAATAILFNSISHHVFIRKLFYIHFENIFKSLLQKLCFRNSGASRI